MPFDPFELVPLGSTGLAVTRLGFGSGSIGGLFRPVSDAHAISTIRHAWDVGIRLFDAAPLYGYGAAERRLGLAVADRPRDAFVLSTKVGRLVRDRSAIEPGMEIDRQADGTRDDAYYADIGNRRIVFDYSADGVRRSIEESLERLRLERSTSSSSTIRMRTGAPRSVRRIQPCTVSARPGWLALSVWE